MDQWNMMVLGAGDQLALAAGLSDGRNLLMCTRLLNLDTIVSKLVILVTIVSKCRIGVMQASQEVKSFTMIRLWQNNYIPVPVHWLLF